MRFLLRDGGKRDIGVEGIRSRDDGSSHERYGHSPPSKPAPSRLWGKDPLEGVDRGQRAEHGQDADCPFAQVTQPCDASCPHQPAQPAGLIATEQAEEGQGGQEQQRRVCHVAKDIPLTHQQEIGREPDEGGA